MSEEIDIKLEQVLNAMLGMMDILDARLRKLEGADVTLAEALMANHEFPFDARDVM